MTSTHYARPRSLDEALDIAAHGDHRVIAGATDIYPSTVGRALRGPALDVTAIDSLRGIERIDDRWRIGACTTWTDLATTSLPSQFRGLQAAARQVGGVQVQNRGTLAGNLVTASPAGDGIAVLFSLSASVEVASVRGARQVPVADFVTGYRTTALAADELVTAIHVPDRPGPSDFQKLGARRHLVISIAMVATHLELATGRVRIAVGACSPTAVRLRGLEAALAEAGDEAIATYRFPELSPIDDVRSSAAYRRRVVGTLVARSVTACREQR